MLKAGVLGAGHLGKIHLKLLKQSPKYDLVGFFDKDRESAEKLAGEMGYQLFDSVDELLEKVDVIDIVTPTVSHHEMAKKALNAGKHIFVEKPIANTVEEGQELIELAKKNKLKAQVGHVERFNPAFQSVKDRIDNPMFIEAHRLAEFNPRGTDVPVVLDLMIHDIDAILSVVKSEVTNVDASGVSVLSDTPDIANARISFKNGCVANLTASRISLKNMRKSRFFQRDAYISVNFLTKESEIVRMKDAPESPDEFAMVLQNAEGKKKQIYFENPAVTENNAILDELENLADSIENNTTVKVSLNEANEALRIAKMVIASF
jgi:hypothetical protein